MRKIDITSKFKKDYKKVRQYPSFKKDVFESVVDRIAKNEALEDKFKVHCLTASGCTYQGYYDLHLAPNICMIYDIQPDKIVLIRIGSHSELGLTN